MRPLFFLALLLSSQVGAVEILTTVKPLQLIANAITEGGKPAGLLLKPGTSPHDYSLKPSDLRRIKNADLVIWVGPELEGFLTPLLGNSNNGLALMAQMPASAHDHHEGSDHDDHQKHDHHDGHAAHEHHDHDSHDAHEHRDHDGHEAHEDHHGHDKVEIADDSAEDEHDHGGRDPHIWLDPHHALHIARLIVERLGELDPANLDRYQANLVRFESTLADTDKRVAERLAPAQDKGYFVFHDAYGYWEDHYDIPSLGHFTINPERAPGAQTVTRIHQALLDASAECVFAEPQFRPAVVNAVVRGTQARVAVLDPLASDIEAGPDGYFDFMLKLSENMAVCLLNER
ncbi:zinc ABC transporter substrate-binding protein ZnuA [Oceanimonas sp. MB9]|uniref:zinc ABC transporter substrate-binding protein ZnuA n=1 Tax=Oceanimonas sp. MB9 TaxID=2588453 RepID=UPI0013F5C677|nr:zinc ABC transporter substrate-binding protein ZnuA [Oceanimonas sp. MB9]NHH99616.1 High-affinity zinc uptake system protein ZnuA [Oceanimonas sp. MB9]